MGALHRVAMRFVQFQKASHSLLCRSVQDRPDHGQVQDKQASGVLHGFSDVDVARSVESDIKLCCSRCHLVVFKKARL